MRFRRIFLIFLLIWGLSAVLRETGIITLEYYKSSISSNINSKWNGLNMATDLVLKDPLDTVTAAQLACDDAPLTAIPVEIQYDGGYWGYTDSPCAKLKIRLAEFSPGIIWTPLVKAGTFSAAVYTESVVIKYVRVGKKVQTKIFRPGGTFMVTGSYTIYGICSYRQAKKLILEQVLSQLYQSGKAQVQTWN